MSINYIFNICENQICCLKVSLFLLIVCVSLVAVLWKWRNIYFYRARLLHLYGRWCGIRLVSRGWTLVLFPIILFSLFMQQVVEKLGAHSSYGFFLPGLCRMSEIIAF